MKGALNTRWDLNDEGDIVCEFEGDSSWRTVAMAANYFEGCKGTILMKKIANCMNHAYQLGIDAKQNELKEVLGLRSKR